MKMESNDMIIFFGDSTYLYIKKFLLFSFCFLFSQTRKRTLYEIRSAMELLAFWTLSIIRYSKKI
jgi:hypothetical protein